MLVFVSDMFEAPKIAESFDLVISVFDPNVKPSFNLGKDRHFIAKFWDTEHPDERDWIQMDRECRTILAWVRSKASEDTSILVHCHAGVSRSSAIAWLIKIQSGQDPKQAFQELFKQRSKIWPNKVVMGIGSQFLQMDFMKLVSDIDAEIATNHTEFLGYGG